jgi:hypothetical protein
MEHRYIATIGDLWPVLQSQNASILAFSVEGHDLPPSALVGVAGAMKKSRLVTPFPELCSPINYFTDEQEVQPGDVSVGVRLRKSTQSNVEADAWYFDWPGTKAVVRCRPTRTLFSSLIKTAGIR